MKREVIPLELLRRGEWAEVAEVAQVEGAAGLSMRMAELGLRPGSRLRMIEPGWPCLFDLGGSRLSLRSSDAVQVLVHPLPSSVGVREA